MQWSEGVQKAWACYEIFRRLGFESSQISYGVVQGVAFGAVTKVVRVQVEADGKEFGVHVALWPGEPEKFLEEWDAFGDRLISRDPAERIDENYLQRIYKAYVAEVGSNELIAALDRKGIRIPVSSVSIVESR